MESVDLKTVALLLPILALIIGAAKQLPVPARWAPLVPIAAGIILGPLCYAAGYVASANYVDAALTGLVAGLTALGGVHGTTTIASPPDNQPAIPPNVSAAALARLNQLTAEPFPHWNGASASTHVVIPPQANLSAAAPLDPVPPAVADTLTHLSAPDGTPTP